VSTLSWRDVHACADNEAGAWIMEMLNDGYLTHWIWGLVAVRDEIRGKPAESWEVAELTFSHQSGLRRGPLPWANI
jgi:hypothetical protein